jgi:hypothetical protein
VIISVEKLYGNCFSRQINFTVGWPILFGDISTPFQQKRKTGRDGN